MIGTLSTSAALAPDVAFAAIPLFGRLRDALIAAARFRDRCQSAGRPWWGVPELFFFDPDLELEWQTMRPPSDRVPGHVIASAARRDPAAARACVELAELADDALTVLAASVEARQAARAIPGLAEAALHLASDHPKARKLAETLAVPDEEVIRVVHPAARAGFRVLVRGVADIYQFHVLLAEAVTGDPARGFLPGARPDPSVLAAYRDQLADEREPVAIARFQLFHGRALSPVGTLPTGFAGSSDWLHGPEPLSTLTRSDGERVVLLGEPTVRTSWDAARRLPWLNGELELVEVMSSAEVCRWIEGRVGRSEVRDWPRMRAAA